MSYRVGCVSLLWLCCFLLANYAFGRSFQLRSPNGRLEVLISDDTELQYSVNLRGQNVIAPSPIGMVFQVAGIPQFKYRILSTAQRSSNATLTPIVPVKRSTLVDQYNEMRVQLTEHVAVLFRVYDEGVAYRWGTTFPDPVKVTSENATFRFPEDAKVWFARETSTFTSQEEAYEQTVLSSLGQHDFASAPVLIGLNSGVKVLLTEADLRDYPGMFLQGSDQHPQQLRGKFAGYPLETVEDGYRHIKVAQHADFLAETTGTRSYPWRVLLVSQEDQQLVNSELVYKLSPPCELDDTAWIRPGKVVWDWWHAQNIRDVDFQPGINTQTYKHYIDFAAENEIEYVLIDEGWSDPGDLFSINTDVALAEILQYAEEKDVDVLLWMVWKTLDRQMPEILDHFQEVGVAGIKVDFMSRDDQPMVNFYHRVAREAAKRKLVVDFHGSYKPTGLRRAFPNVLTRESVRGLEYHKWSDSVTPKNNVTIPFIRMVAGPLDYTPGAMQNKLGRRFKPDFENPSSRSTRCHQLAMYVVYESPLQMLADSPSNYRKAGQCLEFIKQVPTVWDETYVLAGEVSDYIVVARRSRDRWFLGGMTGEHEKQLELKLGFLPPGRFKLRAWEDGLDTAEDAENYRYRELEVSRQSTLPIRMSAGGGWAAIIDSTSAQALRHNAQQK